MSIEKRAYRKAARADAQEETRRRIVAATAALHDEVGPARTTVAEIARRAGVQRATVYANFPGEADLLRACQAHFLAENPPPDPVPPFALSDPRERLEAVLGLRYAWYRRTRGTSGNVRRDRAGMPELDALLRESVDARMAALADALAPEGGERRALVALALDFWTWSRLTDEGLADDAAAALMAGAVLAAAGGAA
ncbi:MAG TPA: helix-turn-helix domain-containing protein [Miltoncostaeaceae bacterium]|jgi:AcrR family transcriptional regulator|nr:helix-turn-helix domain-containing protein [Miltoncostaeaceae bacterium]